MRAPLLVPFGPMHNKRPRVACSHKAPVMPRHRATVIDLLAALLRAAARTDRKALAKLRRLLRRIGLVSAMPHPGLNKLTPTEIKVAKEVAANDDKLSVIWKKLGMEKRTFDTHLDAIYDKLGTRKRSGLSRILGKAGWV